MKRLGFCIALMCIGSSALAQQCDTIITKGLREYDISSESSSYLNNVFSQYCHESGEARSSSSNVGLEAIVKAIPIKFSLGSTSSQTAMQNFCKTYRGSTEAQQSRDTYRETIATKSLDSYVDCVQLSQLGFYVTHDVITAEKAQVMFRAGVGKPIEINGIDTSSNVACVGSVNGKEQRYTVATKVKSDNTISVFCTRSSRKGAGDVTVFDEGSVAVDITGHKYNFFLPKAEIIPENVASRVQASLVELRGALEGHEQMNAAVRQQVGTLLAKAVGPTSDGGTASNAVWAGSAASCPNGQYLVGVRLGWKGTCRNQCDGDGGILGGITLVCRSFK